MRRRTLAAFAATLAFPLLAAAQAWPQRPVTLYQGFNAGGNADTIARIVGDRLAKELGQPVVVESKTGAGGNIASGYVAKAPADGYTLILLTGGHAVSAAMYKQLPFDPLRSFDWLSLVTKFPFVLATRAGSRFKSVADVVAEARAHPGQISFSSVGVGTTQHLAGELFQSMAGVRLNHIPYRGGAAPLQDVLAGRVDVMFDSVTLTRSHIAAGTLRGLGVTSLKASPQLPGVPPIAETVPGYEVDSWTAVAAPAGLPADVSRRLQAAIAVVLKDPDVQRRLEATGGVVSATRSGDEARDYVAGQVAQWKKVVHDAGIEQQ